MCRAVAIAVVFILSALICGCMLPIRAYSPPAMLPPVGSVRPVAPAGVEISAGLYSRTERRGSSVGGGLLHARLGLAPGIEANFGGRIGWLTQNNYVSPSTQQFAGRSGLRLAPLNAQDFVSFDLGLGGGSHDGGTFLSPDVAIAGGFGNTDRGIVPTVRFETWASVPTDPRSQPIVLEHAVEPAPGLGGIFDRGEEAVWGEQRPELTYGYMFRVGARFRLSGSNVFSGTSIDCSIGVGNVTDSQDSMYVNDVGCSMSFRGIADPKPDEFTDPMARDPLWPG